MWNGMGQSVPGTGMDMHSMGGGNGMGMGGGYGGGMGGGMGMGMGGGYGGGMGGGMGGGGSGGRGGRPIAGVDGNWACPACGNVNFAMRSVCNRCKEPKPSQEQVAHQANRAPSQSRNGAPIEGVDGNWACSACANINFAQREVCNRCQAPKPPPDEIMARHAQLAEERTQDAAATLTLTLTLTLTPTLTLTLTLSPRSGRRMLRQP